MQRISMNFFIVQGFYFSSGIAASILSLPGGLPSVFFTSFGRRYRTVIIIVNTKIALSNVIAMVLFVNLFFIFTIIAE